jgi:hypothetical protein
MNSRRFIALTQNNDHWEYSRSGLCIAAKAASQCPLRVKRVTSVRSRRLRNVRYASNTDRIDASQQNVILCHEPTYAVQQIALLLHHLVGAGEK